MARSRPPAPCATVCCIPATHLTADGSISRSLLPGAEAKRGVCRRQERLWCRIYEPVAPPQCVSTCHPGSAIAGVHVCRRFPHSCQHLAIVGAAQPIIAYTAKCGGSGRCARAHPEGERDSEDLLVLEVRIRSSIRSILQLRPIR